MAILIYFVFLLLSSTSSWADKIHFKGNLLFRETGANYLNQEHMMFSRILDTNDLRVFAQTYQESSNTYASFCDSITRLSYKINPLRERPDSLKTDRNFTIIASTSPHSVAEAAAVCRSMGARLPEIRTRTDDRDLLEAVEKFKVKTVLAGIPPYYGGVYTNKWYTALSWSDSYLTNNAHNYYLTYVKAKDGLAIRLSDSETLKEQNIILCQKPILDLPLPTSVEDNILIQMTMGYCTREAKSITESTNQAIEQIELITTLKLDIKTNKTNAENFLPHFSREKRIISDRYKRNASYEDEPSIQWSQTGNYNFQEPKRSFL
jgi:hypothetical protein